ncbi:hypothetical protein [Novosphingobium sp. 17-62-19]|uniref:hypothetical protein n=1 Tax=Novosphingobium sp. 17-62-19 TaxID=1970406 RepID=UPI0025EE222F|nr:hypothetical protein [Novosphingobium sp. 17-62-19]HQS96159.1 hypothetical protein [Novosphingobium sp.]
MTMLARNDYADCGSPPMTLMQGLCAIIAREIGRRDLSLRHLCEAGAIRRRQGFRERLAAATLCSQEIDALVRYLEIDPVRVVIALEVFGDSESYFETLGLNLSNVCRALKGAAERHEAALDCAFEPMRPGLCAAIADRICQALVAHHARVEEARSAAL